MAQGEEGAVEQTVAELRELGEALILRPDRVSVTVRPERLLEAAQFIKDKLRFDHPVCAGAVDYLQENRFEVVYYVGSSSTRKLLMLRVNVPRDRPTVPSLTSVWEGMDYHERETKEMLGIEFIGHPNPVRLLLPEDWEGGFPLRKDFKRTS